MKKKEEFQNPEIEIIVFSETDVVAASGEGEVEGEPIHF